MREDFVITSGFNLDEDTQKMLLTHYKIIGKSVDINQKEECDFGPIPPFAYLLKLKNLTTTMKLWDKDKYNYEYLIYQLTLSNC